MVFQLHDSYLAEGFEPKNHYIFIYVNNVKLA